jgi:hypothetical protein
VNRTLVYAAILFVVAALTWSLSTFVGAAVLGGREKFLEWRVENATRYYALWGVEVVSISLPLILITRRRMQARETERDKKVVAASGVGRLTMAAIEGSDAATGKLVTLLDHREPAVRYQAARGLVMVDRPEPNRELLRKVAYWPGDQKIAMIDVLRKMKDRRARRLLTRLSKDRSQIVSGRASLALASLPGGGAKSGEDIVKRRTRETQAAATQEAARHDGRSAAKKKPPTTAARAPAADDRQPSSAVAGAENPTSPDAGGDPT